MTPSAPRSSGPAPVSLMCGRAELQLIDRQSAAADLQRLLGGSADDTSRNKTFCSQTTDDGTAELPRSRMPICMRSASRWNACCD